MWQIFLLLWQNFQIFVAKFGKIWDYKMAIFHDARKTEVDGGKDRDTEN